MKPVLALIEKNNSSTEVSDVDLKSIWKLQCTKSCCTGSSRNPCRGACTFYFKLSSVATSVFLIQRKVCIIEKPLMAWDQGLFHFFWF